MAYGVRRNKLVVFDGFKSMSPWDVDDSTGWTDLTNDHSNRQGIDLLYQRIPWLYRAAKARRNAVSHVPFAVVDNSGNDFDTYDDWQNKIGFLPNPKQMLSQLELSLIMTGRAYAFKETNRAGIIKSLRYISPSTITPIIDSERGLTGFKRQINGRTTEYPPEQILHIFDTDYLTEAGPGDCSDAIAALSAAGVLYHVDEFSAKYFARGAIKATVLAANGTDSKEAERLKNWWRDVIGGIKNAWAAFVLRGDLVKATVIGEGLEGLSDGDLIEKKRQDVATAIGVPESMLWSAAANYATAENDVVAFFRNTVLPDCDLIAEAFNAQIFTPMGYHWDFRPEPETEDADPLQEANAYAAYVNAGVKPSIAAQLVGIEMPEDVEYEDLDPEEKPQAPETPAAPEAETPPPAPVNPVDQQATVRATLDNWKRKALFSLKNHPNANCPFDTDVIPADTVREIHEQLAEASTPDEVKRIFKDARDCLIKDHEPSGFELLISELKRANDLLESVKQ